MKPITPTIALALLVAGCGSKPTPQERAISDAADVAAVEAAQHMRPPEEPIMLQPITAADLQRHDLSDAGCSFLPHGAADGAPLLVTLPQRAVFKLDERFMVAAADPGSAELPFATRTRYDGRKYSLRLLEVAAGEEKKFSRNRFLDRIPDSQRSV